MNLVVSRVWKRWLWLAEGDGMTALGKWLVVLHAGFSILLASMAVV